MINDKTNNMSMRPAILVGNAHDADEIKKCGLGEYDIIDLSHERIDLDVGRRYLCYGKDSFTIINSSGEVELTSKLKVRGYGIHFGLRGDENFHCCTKIPYLKTAEGYLFKFCYLDYRRSDPTWLNEQSYNAMLKNYENLKLTMKDLELTQGISKKNGKPWYRMTYKTIHLSDEAKRYLTDEELVNNVPNIKYYKIVRTELDIIRSLTYFTDLEVGTYIGLDYETHGKKGRAIPFDNPEFGFMGVALSTTEGIAAYFDLEYYFREGNEKLLKVFKDYYKVFLDKHGSNCITYNVSFEMRCTYLLLGVMYPFQDAASLNKIEGNIEKNYTLKFTAQKYLPGIGSWDDAFDHFQNLFWKLFSNCTPDNYKDSDEWRSIVDYSMNPSINADVNEIELLISLYWDDVFACIPSEVLGKYCCKDAFNTVLIRKCSDDLGYTQRCWSTFDANMRLGAELHIGGQYIDYNTDRLYSKNASWFTSYGKLNVSLAYSKWTLEELSIPDYEIPDTVMNILMLGKNPYDSKDHCSAFFDGNGFNDKLAAEVLGVDYEYYKSMLSDQDYKKLKRCRKVWDNINSYVSNKYQLSIDIDVKLLVKKYHLKSNIRKLEGLLSLMHIKEPKTGVEYEGEWYSISRLNAFADSIINTNSPDTRKILRKYLMPTCLRIMHEVWFHPELLKDHLLSGELLPLEWDAEYEDKLDWLLSGQDIKTLNNNWYFRENLNARDIVDIVKVIINNYNSTGDKELDNSIESLSSDIDSIGNDYPPALYLMNHRSDLKKLDWSDYKKKYRGYGREVTPYEVVADIEDESLYGKTGSISANIFRSRYMSRAYISYPETKDLYLDMFDSLDPSEHNTRGLSKFGACYRMSRKYIKSLAYLDGMLIDGIRNTGTRDKDGWITEKWSHGDMDPEQDKLANIYTKFNVIEKKSGRWSCALHTIQAHGTESSVKRCISSPSGCLMSYFDISGAEVRGISYVANDEFMLKSYSTPRNEDESRRVSIPGREWDLKGADPYIMMAKVIKPGESESYYKLQRPNYKTILLGALYGMGIQMLAQNTNQTIEEAQIAYNKMFDMLHGIKLMIEKKSSYPMNEDTYGMVDTLLGNKISIKNESKDRWARLGINLCVQGGSALFLADGFESCTRNSFSESKVPEGSIAPVGSNWNLKIRPWNVVHDSMQANWNADGIFRIQEYYAMYMQKYLYDKHGVNFAFDLEVGKNYYDMAELQTIEYDKKIKLTGSKTALDLIMKELDLVNCSYKVESLISSAGNNCLDAEGNIDPNLYISKIPDMFLGFLSYDTVYYKEDESKYILVLNKVD